MEKKNISFNLPIAVREEQLFAVPLKFHSAFEQKFEFYVEMIESCRHVQVLDDYHIQVIKRMIFEVTVGQVMTWA